MQIILNNSQLPTSFTTLIQPNNNFPYSADHVKKRQRIETINMFNTYEKQKIYNIINKKYYIHRSVNAGIWERNNNNFPWMMWYFSSRLRFDDLNDDDDDVPFPFDLEFFSLIFYIWNNNDTKLKPSTDVDKKRLKMFFIIAGKWCRFLVKK